MILVGLSDGRTSARMLDEHLDELERLVETAGGAVLGRICQERKAPDAAYWLGRGKAEELGRTMSDLGATLVVAEGELSPVQMRNLQEVTGGRVLARSDLILDIFARHARTREARLAVELALLEQQLPRLVGQWYGLSRQGGGIGTRGVGETRLELDRRVVRTRIAKLKRELERVGVSSSLRRRGRSGAHVVALAGYTNAGKSSLFTRLTRTDTLAADQLFATLDARHGRLDLEGGRSAIVVDTVGFIRRLPHRLIASFRSTLAEIREASLVLHVVDRTHPAVEEQIEVVEETLEELGVEASAVVRVWNKVDLLGGVARLVPAGEAAVSALTGEGVEELLRLVADRLAASWTTASFSLPVEDGGTLAEIRREGEVIDCRTTDERIELTAKVSPELLGRLRRRGIAPRGEEP